MARLITLRLVKFVQPLAPQQLQAGAAFSAVVQLPQEPPPDLEGLVALLTTITILVEACSGRHKSQPLEVRTLEAAYSAAATREDLARPTISSKLVHSELP